MMLFAEYFFHFAPFFHFLAFCIFHQSPILEKLTSQRFHPLFCSVRVFHKESALSHPRGSRVFPNFHRVFHRPPIFHKPRCTPLTIFQKSLTVSKSGKNEV